MTKKERYEARKAAGLCVLCGKPAAEGKVKCAECTEKEKKYNKELREWRKSINICTACGKYPAYNGSMCLVCRQDARDRNKYCYKGRSEEEREKHNQRNKALYERYKSEGKCPKCGRKLPKESKNTYCVECRNRINRNERERMHKTGKTKPLALRGNGEYCACCFKPVEHYGDKLCTRCKALAVEKCAKMREKVPKDNYFARAISAQWKESKARKDETEQ